MKNQANNIKIFSIILVTALEIVLYYFLLHRIPFLTAFNFISNKWFKYRNVTEHYRK